MSVQSLSILTAVSLSVDTSLFQRLRWVLIMAHRLRSTFLDQTVTGPQTFARMMKTPIDAR